MAYWIDHCVGCLYSSVGDRHTFEVAKVREETEDDEVLESRVSKTAKPFDKLRADCGVPGAEEGTDGSRGWIGSQNPRPVAENATRTGHPREL